MYGFLSSLSRSISRCSSCSVSLPTPLRVTCARAGEGVFRRLAGKEAGTVVRAGRSVRTKFVRNTTARGVRGNYCAVVGRDIPDWHALWAGGQVVEAGGAGGRDSCAGRVLVRNVAGIRVSAREALSVGEWVSGWLSW
eukprot:4088715-Pleurochrysis_carterae.AAC.1